jgi:hypothetical protein
MDRRFFVLALLTACDPTLAPLPTGDTEIAAADLCEAIVEVVCDTDARCCGSTPPNCREVQRIECGASLQPLLDDPRLGYDPLAGGALVASLRESAAGCWTPAVDYDAVLTSFAGTGIAGADCTPPDMSMPSLRASALSCTRGLSCRLYLLADGSAEGECGARTDDACSHPLDCGAGQFCALPDAWRPGVWGTCRPLRADGWACASDLECASRHCDGTCAQPTETHQCLETEYGSVVLEASPIAYLRFDETAGARAEDEIGLHPGALTNTATRDASGAIAIMREGEMLPVPPDGEMPMIEDGGSIRFASDDASVRVMSMNELAGASALTFEAWIRPDSAESPGPIVELNDMVDFGPHLWSHDRGDELWVNFVAEDGTQFTIGSNEGAVSVEAWHHVAASFDGTTARLFLDGRMIGEVAASGPLRTTGDLYIGHRPTGETPRSFRGSIDEVAVYDRALEADEISRHHRAGQRGLLTTRFALFRWLER